MGEPSGADGFSLRRIAVPAFGPTALWSVGLGATMPVVALSARALGASVAVAALFVGINTVSELLSAVPSGVLVERMGERRALVLAGVADAAAAALAMVAPSLWVLAVAVALSGPTGAVFLLARQSYLTAAAPESMRARAMSTLGGVGRVGMFVGPFLAAPVVGVWGPQAAFGIAVVAGLAAAALAWSSPDLGVHRGKGSDGAPAAPIPVREVVRRNRAVLLTVGVGVLAIGLARSSRVVVVPLWAEHVGLSAAQTALVFGAAGLVEVLLFYPAGSIMDRRGRVWVALPVTVLLGLGLVVLPLTSTLVAVGAVAVVMGVGNGLGSGIVMTLGADAAPVEGRAPFLGVWRLLSLLGHNGAALVVGALTAVVSLGAASVVVGVLTLAGGAWLLRWLPRHDPRRRPSGGRAPG
ncbi:MFS transporter [Phycicoccus duodecadis]|uniref:Putative MFS family arabinose efflux permease n=1 Tax=Phycicoccus duodecadis TaxID=173053 RepID=A0A2N3YL48_9MICO|nr:MFS transporter [Phycicoccus duodecadis]PKW27529.1 putative MFS family arabinose efflux permease [Phycicoccus duodecadis]